MIGKQLHLEGMSGNDVPYNTYTISYVDGLFVHESTTTLDVWSVYYALQHSFMIHIYCVCVCVHLYACLYARVVKCEAHSSRTGGS